MIVKEFVEKFKSRNIINSKVNPNAISDYIQTTLELKTYVPFQEKRKIVEEIVKRNIVLIDGIKKNDNISQYIDFVIAMLKSHTNLEFSNEIAHDYDILSESGLLPTIINEFQSDYNECDILLKMALAAELEDNNLSAVLSKILHNGIDIVKLFNLIAKLNK